MSVPASSFLSQSAVLLAALSLTPSGARADPGIVHQIPALSSNASDEVIVKMPPLKPVDGVVARARKQPAGPPLEAAPAAPVVASVTDSPPLLAISTPSTEIREVGTPARALDAGIESDQGASKAPLRLTDIPPSAFMPVTTASDAAAAIAGESARAEGDPLGARLAPPVAADPTRRSSTAEKARASNGGGLDGALYAAPPGCVALAFYFLRVKRRRVAECASAPHRLSVFARLLPIVYARLGGKGRQGPGAGAGPFPGVSGRFDIGAGIRRASAPISAPPANDAGSPASILTRIALMMRKADDVPPSPANLARVTRRRGGPGGISAALAENQPENPAPEITAFGGLLEPGMAFHPEPSLKRSEADADRL